MIETDRLILRPWQDSDAEALFRYASDPDVGPRAGWPPHKDIEESKRVIRDIFTNDRTWAVTLRETGEPIGCMGYYIHGESNIPIGEEDAEIGYWIAKPYWNRGIATEALRVMVDNCSMSRASSLCGRTSSSITRPPDVLWRNSDSRTQENSTGAVVSIPGMTDTVSRSVSELR